MAPGVVTTRTGILDLRLMIVSLHWAPYVLVFRSLGIVRFVADRTIDAARAISRHIVHYDYLGISGDVSTGWNFDQKG